MEQQNINNLWDEISKLKEQMAGKEFQLKEEINKGMDKINEENAELKAKNLKLEEENQAMKKKMAKMDAYMKEVG